MSLEGRGARFRALHEREKLFVMPNPWDAGSARLLESAGFEALATTSAGFAWSTGKLISGCPGTSSSRTFPR